MLAPKDFCKQVGFCGTSAPVGLFDAPLWLWPVLYAASRDVAVERVCGKGQILCVSLGHTLEVQ